MRVVLLAALVSFSGHAEPIKVTAYGDSTQRWHGEPHASSRPPHFIIANRGVSGSTAGQLLEGADGLNAPWDQQLAGDVAHWVIINHGLNISGGTTTQQYRGHIIDLVVMARRAGKRVMLEMPNNAAPHGEFDVPAFLDRQASVRELARVLGVHLCEQPSVPLADGAHPTPAGYSIKAERLAKCLMKAI